MLYGGGVSDAFTLVVSMRCQVPREGHLQSRAWLVSQRERFPILKDATLSLEGARRCGNDQPGDALLRDMQC